MNELEQAIQEIEVYGFTLLEGVLAPDEVGRMREALIRCEQEVAWMFHRMDSTSSTCFSPRLRQVP